MIDERKQPAQGKFYSASALSGTRFEPEDVATRTLPSWSLGITVIVLAVVAVVGLSQGGSNSAPARQDRAATTVNIQPVQTDPLLLLYLVETQEQYDLAYSADAQAAQERMSSGAAEPNYTMIVINTEAPNAEEYLRDVLAAWTERGWGIHLVDMRQK
jgi:hypothetical protein